VRVSINANGDLAAPRPNNIFAVSAEQLNGGKVELVWYYCPLDQEQALVRFMVYFDGGTGRVDYESPIATTDYTGRKFYSYQSDSLDPGRYLFCIRAEGANAAKGACVQVSIGLDTNGPAEVDILDAKAA
jgi:hypothetical protein